MCGSANLSTNGSRPESCCTTTVSGARRGRSWLAHQVLRQPGPRGRVTGPRGRDGCSHNRAPVLQRHGIQEHAHVVGLRASMRELALDERRLLPRHVVTLACSGGVLPRCPGGRSRLLAPEQLPGLRTHTRAAHEPDRLALRIERNDALLGRNGTPTIQALRVLGGWEMPTHRLCPEIRHRRSPRNVRGRQLTRTGSRLRLRRGRV